jgi:ATP-dependent DNA helicase RecG
MAPTEILARQHYKTISSILCPFGLRVCLLTGSKKDEFTQQYTVLIGTHALLSEKVLFQKVGLSVIDEQQRFGVDQRALFRQKAITDKHAHFLTMTATPIPRTVALTIWGDLDISYINELPVGRKTVKTWLVPAEKRDNAYEWIRKTLTEYSSQAYIICPFIEESESLTSVNAAAVEYKRLKETIYPDISLGLLHGNMKSAEKDAVLEKFTNNDITILVSTPVVEVGIDVPNAVIILIEASERFGLAQLHQLRGRVGRGERQSYCLLFTQTNDNTALQRLKSLETIYSGLALSELDLKLRGPGSLFGTMQHGMPKLHAASFSDTQLIIKARHAADEIFTHLDEYPLLQKKLNKLLAYNILPD